MMSNYEISKALLQCIACELVFADMNSRVYLEFSKQKETSGMVTPVGFEPTTLRLEVTRSIQLSYGAKPESL